MLIFARPTSNVIVKGIFCKNSKSIPSSPAAASSMDVVLSVADSSISSIFLPAESAFSVTKELRSSLLPGPSGLVFCPSNSLINESISSSGLTAPSVLAVFVSAFS